MDGRIKLRPGLDFSRPFRKERHVGAALEQRELPAAIGLIDIGQADIGCATIIAGEDDEGIVGETGLRQLFGDATNAAIQGENHRGINA